MHQPFLPLSVLRSDLMRNVKHCVIHIHCIESGFRQLISSPCPRGQSANNSVDTRSSSSRLERGKKSQPHCQETAVCFLEAEIRTE